MVKFCVQFKFWANFAKPQTEWICTATVVGQGGVLCRRGRAASARDATRLATQLLAAVPRADVLIQCRFNDARIKPEPPWKIFFFP